MNIRNKKTISALSFAGKRLPPIRQNQNNQAENQDESESVRSQVHYNSRFATQHHSLTYQHYINNILQRMQPRDQRIIIPFLNKIGDFKISENIKQFDKWLGQMHFAISSAAFKHLMTKQLTYEEVKVYFSENLLLNLLLFLQQASDNETYSIMKYLNTRLIDNLFYMVSKYPISKQIKPNKKLRQIFSSIDNMGNDLNDMLNFSSVRFVKKDDNDYTPEIMKTINYLIQIASQTCTYLGKKTTYYNAFCQVMQKIFQSVQYPTEELSQNQLFESITGFKFGAQALSRNQISQPQQGQKQYIEGKSQPNQRLHRHLSSPQRNLGDNLQHQQRKKMKISQKQLKQYRQKVKKYTSYKINQKINPNTELYTDNQINNSNFSVKNTAILRILTKWTSQLKNKIFESRQEIKNRSFRFKVNGQNNSNQFVKLNSSQKNDLYQTSRKKIPVLTSYLENMLNQCIEVEGVLAKNNQTSDKMSNIPRHQFLVGSFCARLQSAASTYILSYLNKIIQSLLEIPLDRASNEEKGEFETQRKKNVNLITFKVADLMRCKCHSKESQILRILSIIKKISDENHDLFKIIRIRDRLQLGTRDIMINIIFMNRIICEIQLAISDDFQQKQKMYDSFNHYLYELRRSDLGPIMESACIWTHLDQRSKLYKNMLAHSTNQMRMIKTRKHTCHPSMMIPYNYAFICSLCSNYYSYPTGLIRNKKCSSCKKYYQCNICLEQKMSEKDRKAFLGLLSKQLTYFQEQFQQWTYQEQKILPIFAIFISKKDKQISYIFAQKLYIKQSTFYIKTEQNPISRKVEAKTIVIMKSQSKKQITELLKNYFIFEWTQKRHINKTILSSQQKIRQMRIKQAKQEQEIRRRKQREKIKQQIKLQKQMVQKKWGSLIPVEEQSGQQDKPTKKKNKKSKGQGQQGNNQGKNTQARESATDDNVNRFLKMLIPKVIERPGTANSKTSKQSKTSSKYNKLDDQPETNIQIITKISDYNDVRVAQKIVGSHKYNLILNYYLSESQIRQQLKQNYNKTYVKQLLLNKKQVLFLQESKISEKSMMISHQLYALNSKALSSVYQMYLDQNKISTLQFIVNFPKLRVLHANSNFIKDMSQLTNLQNLIELMLANNSIQQISGLQKKYKLITLRLDRNCIRVIENLQGVPKLIKLSLYGNQILKIDGLQELNCLKQCDLSINQIQKIEGLQKLTKLQKLFLSSNQITKIQNLQKVKDLKLLDISRNKLKQMDGLSQLHQLKYLNLQKNQITQIKGLDNLKKLQHLDLSSNQIQKIQNMEKQNKLIILDLGSNKIQTIDFDKIEPLVSLQNLNLSFNRLFQINRQLIKFLPKLKQLSLVNNPLDKKNQQNFKNLQKMREKIIVMAIQNYCVYVPK